MTNRTAMQERVTARANVIDTGYDTPCWISDRATNGNGYTKIGHLGSTWYTHRFAYVAFVGPIPEGLQLDHLCRVRACCNPEHLEPVSCRENLLRGDTLTAREAAATHCIRGHEFTEANTYRRTDRASRECLTCRNSWRQRCAS